MRNIKLTIEYDGKEIETWEYWENKETGEKLIGQYYGNSSLIPVTKPYFKGWKTSIRIGAFDKNGVLKEIGTCSSGITDELREDFALNPDKYIGQTMMAQCMEKDKKAHTLRHPIFKGFRIDKDARECTLEEVFA